MRTIDITHTWIEVSDDEKHASVWMRDELGNKYALKSYNAEYGDYQCLSVEVVEASKEKPHE